MSQNPNIPIDPKVEFDPVPLVTARGVLLIGEIEGYLAELSVPQEATWKKIGIAVLTGFAMSMELYRPYPRQT